MLKKWRELLKKRQNFILYSFFRVSVQLITFIINIFIIRQLSVSDYGVYSLALMIVGFAVTFGFSWSSSAIVYFGSREKADSGSMNRSFWARNIILLAGLLFVSVLFIVFRNWINSYVGMELAFLILFWVYVRVIEDYIANYYLAARKQLLSSVLRVTGKLIVLIFVLFFSFDVKLIIIMSIVSNLSVILYLLGINKKDIGTFEFDKQVFREVLSFSAWQLFGFSGLYIINFGDSAVIKYFMTVEDVGLYNAGYRLFNGVAGLAYVISSYYAASISVYVKERQEQKLRAFFYKERFLIYGAAVVLHLLVIAFSRQLILFFYDDRYLVTVPIFNILMLGSLVRYFGVFYILYFNTNKKYKVAQYLNILRSLLNLVLDVVFIKFFGLIGPAIATTAAIFITTAVSYFYCEGRIKEICRLPQQKEE